MDLHAAGPPQQLAMTQGTLATSPQALGHAVGALSPEALESWAVEGHGLELPPSVLVQRALRQLPVLLGIIFRHGDDRDFEELEAAWPSGAGTALALQAWAAERDQRARTRSRSPRRAAGTDAERGAADVDEPAVMSDSEPAPGRTGGTAAADADTETVMVTTEGLDDAAAADGGSIINVSIDAAAEAGAEPRPAKKYNVCLRIMSVNA